MERLLQTHHFGPHRVDVVQGLDDDGRERVEIFIDNVAVTTPALTEVPRLEDVVRIYTRWRAAAGAR